MACKLTLRRTRRSSPWRRLWLIAAVAASCLPAAAHTPHHVIDDLVVSPDYENDSTVFILVYNELLRSTDRGFAWQPLVNGVDTPFVLTDAAISPQFSEDGTLFVASDGGGVYRSTDRGNSWVPFVEGLPRATIGRLFVSGSGVSQRLLAAGTSRGLFVTPTGDAAWRRAISDDVQVTALASGRFDGRRVAIAGDARGGLWTANGSLEDWEPASRLSGSGRITAIEPAGSNGGWIVGTEKLGLLRVGPDGMPLESKPGEWPAIERDCRGEKLSAPIQDLHVRDIDVLEDGETLLVTTWRSAVHESRDGGRNWRTLDRGLSCNVQADAPGFGTPHFRNLEVVPGPGSDWFLASFDGLFRSSDGGQSWLRLEAMPAGLIRGMAVSPTSADGQHVALTTYGGGAYISADAGGSWTVANQGLDTTRMSDATFAPVAAGDPYLYGLSREHLLTRDRGASSWDATSVVYQGWRRRVGAGLERYLRVSSQYGKDFFLDAAERSGIWPMQIGLSPAYANDRTILLGFRRQGIWRSDDGGESWNRDWDGPRDYVTDLELSPAFATDGTAFAGFRGAGIYVTRDGAERWHASNNGFEFLSGWRASQAPNHSIDPPQMRALTDSVLAVSPGFASDQTVFAGSAAGLFRSTNGGRDWHRILPRSDGRVAAIIGLAAARRADGKIEWLVSVKGQGLVRSSDGGDTFEPVVVRATGTGIDLRYLAYSPDYGTDDTIYAASGWGMYVSRDGGVGWSRVRPPVRYEDWRGTSSVPIVFTGDWHRERGEEHSASTQSIADSAGASASLSAYTTGFSWVGERGPSGGIARVSLDGQAAVDVDLFSEQADSATVIYATKELEPGEHRLLIEVTGRANPASSGHRVTIDGIDVEGISHD